MATRVSDQDRERATEQLRAHFADGRLTEDELEERLQTAYRAQTDEQLQAVVADLPVLPATPAQHKAELAQRRGHLQRRLLQEAGGGLGVFAICTVVWAAAGAHHQAFWPIWVLLIVLIPLMRNAWRLYGPAPELDRVQRELDSRQQRSEHRGRSRRRLQ